MMAKNEKLMQHQHQETNQKKEPCTRIAIIIVPLR